MFLFGGTNWKRLAVSQRADEEQRLMKMNIKLTAIIGAALLTVSLCANALEIKLGGPLPDFREAKLDSAIAGVTGDGNATVADVDDAFAALAPWTELGQSTEDGDEGIFEVSLATGSWGEGKASGTWRITDAAFWTKHANGAISLHVGGGKDASPDHFIWLLEQNQLSGSWSYDRGDTKGGGLSNLKLYGSGEGTSVPDGGVTIALMGLGLLSLSAFRRRVA